MSVDLGGRKFKLVCFASLAYTVLFLFGFLDQSGYTTLQMMTVGAYIAGNVAQKFAEKR